MERLPLIPFVSFIIAILLVVPAAMWAERHNHEKRRSLLVPDERGPLIPPELKQAFKVLLAIWIGVTFAFLVGCDSHKAEPDTIAGAESSKISFPAFPNFPSLPAPPGGTVTVTTGTTTDQTATAPVSTGATTETLSYNGRYNGDRPTWYGKKKLSAYPATITIDITGCFSRTIKHNGTRYDSGGLIVKQSDVSGRGMAVVAPSSCQSKTAYVRY